MIFILVYSSSSMYRVKRNFIGQPINATEGTGVLTELPNKLPTLLNISTIGSVRDNADYLTKELAVYSKS